MASTAPVLLILGSGPKVGAAVARAFLSKGYRVATASRSLNDEQQSDNEISMKLDLSKPEDVPAAYSKVEKTFGTAPSVVVYNAASAQGGVLPAQDPLSKAALENYIASNNVNAASVLVAAKAAVEGFKTLPASTKKTFIFTGNILPLKPIPALITFGMGKSAAAHLIMSATAAYKDQGYRFYFGDERVEDGGPAIKGVDGPSHAEAYLYLAESDKQEPWFYTFVKGSPDYVDFGAPKL